MQLITAMDTKAKKGSAASGLATLGGAGSSRSAAADSAAGLNMAASAEEEANIARRLCAIEAGLFIGSCIVIKIGVYSWLKQYNQEFLF